MNTIFLDDETEIEAPCNYVIEGMFFNPRSARSTYLVKSEDKYLMVNLLGSYVWCDAPTSDVGRLFKDILVERSDIILLAIPLKFKFNNNSIHNALVCFDWSALGFGFGQLSFGINRELQKVEFGTESIDPDTTRKILHDFVDFIIDNGYSEDWT